MHLDRCFCSIIPSIELRTRLTLVIHSKEMKRTTNSGRLAVEALTNSEIVVRGERGEGNQALDLTATLLEGYRPLFFFPSENALELTETFVATLDKPVQLLVPDGNWRQASKVYGRHSELRDVMCVKISSPNEAAFHLRAEHMAEGMSTLEAIARAIGILECRKAEAQLTKLYQEKLRRTLEGRGVKIDATTKLNN